MAARRPHFIAYSVSDTKGRPRWREIGVAFWNQRQSALTVLFDAIPLTGRLVLRAPDEERRASEEHTEG